MKRLKKGLLFSCWLFLTSCSGLEQSEQEHLRRNNANGEFILRSRNERHYLIETPKHRIRKPYSWEKRSNTHSSNSKSNQ